MFAFKTSCRRLEEPPLHRQPHRAEPLGLRRARLGAPARVLPPGSPSPSSLGAGEPSPAEPQRSFSTALLQGLLGPGGILRGRGQAEEGWAATGGERREQERDSQLQLSSQSGLFFGGL